MGRDRFRAAEATNTINSAETSAPRLPLFGHAVGLGAHSIIHNEKSPSQRDVCSPVSICPSQET